MQEGRQASRQDKPTESIPIKTVVLSEKEKKGNVGVQDMSRLKAIENRYDIIQRPSGS